MNSDNNHDNIKEMLRKSGVNTAPPGIEQQIMNKIMMQEHKRMYKRVMIVSLLRIVLIGAIIFLLVKTLVWLFPRFQEGLTVTKIFLDIGYALAWIAEHVYFIFPLFVLIVANKIVRVRT